MIAAVNDWPCDTIADWKARKINDLCKVFDSTQVVRIHERLDFKILISGFACRLQHGFSSIKRLVDDPILDAGAVLQNRLQLEEKQHSYCDDDPNGEADVEYCEDEAPSCELNCCVAVQLVVNVIVSEEARIKRANEDDCGVRAADDGEEEKPKEMRVVSVANAIVQIHAMMVLKGERKYFNQLSIELLTSYHFSHTSITLPAVMRARCFEGVRTHRAQLQVTFVLLVLWLPAER